MALGRSIQVVPTRYCTVIVEVERTSVATIAVGLKRLQKSGSESGTVKVFAPTVELGAGEISAGRLSNVVDPGVS